MCNVCRLKLTLSSAFSGLDDGLSSVGLSTLLRFPTFSFLRLSENLAHHGFGAVGTAGLRVRVVVVAGLGVQDGVGAGIGVRVGEVAGIGVQDGVDAGQGVLIGAIAGLGVRVGVVAGLEVRVGTVAVLLGVRMGKVAGATSGKDWGSAEDDASPVCYSLCVISLIANTILVL